MPTADSRILEISISVYDTTLPYIGDDGILDFAEKGSIHWIYDGGDNKFLTMMPSRLEFDMEVSIEESLNVLVYDYLFTGNETRYAVVMRDQEERVLWRGFLLPEEYTEPYDKGTFFIHFTATDGLGRLKGHNLPNSFYRARQSIIKIIADCLKKTGLEMEIWLDGSIQNDLAEGYWERLFVDAQQWKLDSEPANCYDILNAVLLEIGSTLFQQYDRWYVVPWNRRGSTNSFSVRKYDKDGIAINFDSVTADEKPVIWYATPSLSIKPPFREVSVVTGITEGAPVFPEDVVAQKISITENLLASTFMDFPPDYWTSQYLNLFLYDIHNYNMPEYLGEPLEFTWYPSFRREFGEINYPDNLNYWMTLKNPEYVKAGVLLDIELDILSSYESSGGTSDVNDDRIMYDILIDNEVIISNKPGWPQRELYKLKFNNQYYGEYGPVHSTASLDFKDYVLETSGYLNIRVYYGGSAYGNSASFMAVSKLNIKYRQQKLRFKKRRVIDFTSKKEVEIFNGDSVITLENKSFVYQPTIPEADFFEIPFVANYRVDYTRNSRPLGWILNMTPTHYAMVFENKYRLYVMRENSDFPEYVREVYFPLPEAFYVKIILPDGHLVKQQDRLLIRSSGFPGDPQITSYIKARENWRKTVYAGTGGRLGDVLAETHHDLQPLPLVTTEGTLKGLVRPLDIMQFELKGTLRNFIPVRIDITPNENQTSCTLIEYKNNKITDYGG